MSSTLDIHSYTASVFFGEAHFHFIFQNLHRRLAHGWLGFALCTQSGHAVFEKFHEIPINLKQTDANKSDVFHDPKLKIKNDAPHQSNHLTADCQVQWSASKRILGKDINVLKCETVAHTSTSVLTILSLALGHPLDNHAPKELMQPVGLRTSMSCILL